MKRKVFLIILLILFICGSLVVINIYEYNRITVKDNITVNVGDDIHNIKEYVEERDYKKINNIEILWKDMIIEENKVYYTGKYLGIINYKDKEYSVYLTVIDSIAPTIEGVKNLEIYVREQIDLYKNIKITDNSKDEIKKEIVGNYDFNKVGTYNLKYVITDKSNNKVEEDFKLVVKERPNVVNSITRKGYTIVQKNGVYYINDIQ